jgi:hypothetical protein
MTRLDRIIKDMYDLRDRLRAVEEAQERKTLSDAIVRDLMNPTVYVPADTFVGVDLGAKQPAAITYRRDPTFDTNVRAAMRGDPCQCAFCREREKSKKKKYTGPERRKGERRKTP